jgi:hypothetical protein
MISVGASFPGTKTVEGVSFGSLSFGMRSRFELGRIIDEMIG